MVQHPFFGEVSKNFNETAAVKVYNAFMEDPDYWRAMMNLHAYDVVNKTILTEPEIIDSLIIDKYNARKELVKEAVLSGVINKTMDNKVVDEVVRVMDLVSKNMNEYTSFERSANVKRQQRGPGGRFVTMGHTKIDVPQGVTGPRGSDRSQGGYWNAQTKAYDNVVQARHGERPPTVHQSPALNAAHSSAYLQIAEALRQMDPTDMMMADITYRKQDENGNAVPGGTFTRTKVGQNVNDFISPDEYGSGEIPTGITWKMDSESRGYGNFDILTGAGASTEAAFDIAGAAGRSGPATRTMNQALEQEYTGERGGQKYGQLGAVASMIETVGGDRISPQGKAALGAAKYVGEYGSEAEKVLGPTARRAAYRYRGTELKPDPKMDKAIMASVAGAKDVNDAHERLIHPVQVTSTDTVRTLDLEGQPAVLHGLDFESENEHSPFIRYWQSQLPNKKYIKLHLDSGTTPPSQGVVFDAKGQIISQSVGYGDDHYLPFNLNKLTGANRGEWVRTRTMGGPTTEDISAALITGARAVTVVSHSGEYVVEFQDDFRGGRRANDKNRRMVRRYAQLLDTLDAENTTLQGIPSDRKREIRDQVAAEIPGMDQRAQQARDTRRKEMEAVERANPTPSQKQRDEWMEEFGQKFADSLADNSNRDEMSWKDVKANLRIKDQRQADADYIHRKARISDWDRHQPGFVEEPEPQVPELSDEEALQRLGADKAYKRFVQSKEAEYRAEQAPLKLNGQGYYFALQALQEQFPHAIKRVEWYPATEDAAKDTGYVPHKFIRPQAAKEGFWNPEIEGVANPAIKSKTGQPSGKVAAHHTNFQNYAARQRVAGQTPQGQSVPQAGQQGGGQQAGGERGSHGTRTPNISPVTGVTFSNLTPNPEINNRTSAGIERRRAALDAQQMLMGMGVTVLNSQGRPEQVRIGHDVINGLPNLSNRNIDTNDEAALDALADEIAGVFNGQIRIEGGNAGTLRDQLRNSPEGQAINQNLGQNFAGGRVRPLQSIESAFRDTQSLWDFSSPDVRGEDFLPGGNRSHRDYLTTLNSDPDIQSIRREYLAGNQTWDAFSRDKTAQILSANRDLRDIASQSYRGGNTVTYAGTDYSVPGGSDELASRVVFDALGLLKTRQLQRYLPPTHTTDPFPRPPQTPRAVGAGAP